MRSNKLICLFLVLFNVAGFFPQYNRSWVRYQLTASFIEFDGGCGSVTKSRFDRERKLYHNYVLTVAHLFRKNDYSILMYKKGHKFLLAEAHVVEKNASMDYAIVEFWSKDRLEHSSFDFNCHYNAIDPIYAVGIPSNSTRWITRGEISTDGYLGSMFGHNANTYLGNSGGPIYNESCRQIGIAKAIRRHVKANGDVLINHISYGVRADFIKRDLGKKFYTYFED